MPDYQKWYQLFMDTYCGYSLEKLESLERFHTTKGVNTVEEKASIDVIDDLISAILETTDWEDLYS